MKEIKTLRDLSVSFQETEQEVIAIRFDITQTQQINPIMKTTAM